MTTDIRSQIETIARMLHEDMSKRRVRVKPWDKCSEDGRNFWRSQARAFLHGVALKER